MPDQLVLAAKQMPHHPQGEACDMSCFDLQTGQRRTKNTRRAIQLDHDITSCTPKMESQHQLHEQRHTEHDRYPVLQSLACREEDDKGGEQQMRNHPLDHRQFQPHTMPLMLMGLVYQHMTAKRHPHRLADEMVMGLTLFFVHGNKTAIMNEPPLMQSLKASKLVTFAAIDAAPRSRFFRLP